MGTKHDVTELYHIARESLYVIHNMLEEHDGIEVMPIAPGDYKLIGDVKEAIYPKIRCEVPGCGLTVLKFDDLWHCSTTLPADFLTENDWDKLKERYIFPMARSLVEDICKYNEDSYLYFARLQPGDGSDGTAWHTLSYYNESVRVSMSPVVTGTQLKIQACCSFVSRQ